jgi:hypothetical protein
MARPHAETIRRLKLGDVMKVCRDRYGLELPDDDAGRDDLEIMLCLNADKNLKNVIEIQAPWMQPAEAEALMDHVKRLPSNVRSMSNGTLGRKLNLTLAQKERIGLRQITPCDLTREELAARRKARHRDREHERRRRCGATTRAAYLAQHSVNREKPWKAAGISRASWYRSRKAVRQLRVQ